MKKRIAHGIVICLLAALLPAAGLAAGGVALNFTDVDIGTMVKFISDLTGKNFVMDERVKGKISIFSPAKLTPEETYNVFTSVLELKGFTVIPVGKVHKIVPSAAARQSGMAILAADERGPVNETYVARVIPLGHISGQEAVGFLQPLVSKDGYLSAFSPGNLLLAVDSSLNIEKILSLLSLIDTDQARETAELIFLKHAAAEQTARVVQEWLGGRAAKPGAPQSISAPGSLVLADTRLNALVAFGSEKDKAAIKRLVEIIDVPAPTTTSRVNVCSLEHADATDMARVLESVVRGAAAAPPSPGQPPSQASPFEGSKITITPDKATNSLVIMAAPADYQNLAQVIQKLDRRRRQVFVQAVIAEVSLDRLEELGVQWGVVGGGSSGSVTAAGIYDPQGAFTPLLGALANLKDAGISIPAMTGTALNFSVILKALNSAGALNVLSTPTILTSDNKEAEIFVGENVPFRGKIDITTSVSPSYQSIERKDTGITLKITPQISEGEFVNLDLYQEISAVKETSVAGAADLITTKRSAKTSVVVKDKETVAIGGLIQDRETRSANQVPGLGDLPLLGWLFKSSGKQREKTNLLILLTPQIVRTADDLAGISQRQQRQFNDSSPTGNSPLAPATVPPAAAPTPASEPPTAPAPAAPATPPSPSPALKSRPNPGESAPEP